MHTELGFKYPSPFTGTWEINEQHLDDYQHVNNVAYLAQCETLAWNHSLELGLGMQQYQEQNRGMVIIRHEIDYLNAAYSGDTINCATWIVDCDKKMRVTREFQFIRQHDKKPILQAKTFYVCVELSSGKLKRMPKLYQDIYSAAKLML